MNLQEDLFGAFLGHTETTDVVEVTQVFLLCTLYQNHCKNCHVDCSGKSLLIICVLSILA